MIKMAEKVFLVIEVERKIDPVGEVKNEVIEGVEEAETGAKNGLTGDRRTNRMIGRKIGRKIGRDQGINQKKEGKTLKTDRKEVNLLIVRGREITEIGADRGIDPGLAKTG